MTANLVSACFQFVSMSKAASFPVSTPIGKETRNEEQCKDLKRFKIGILGLFAKETNGNEGLEKPGFVSSLLLGFAQFSFPLVSSSFPVFWRL